MENNFKCYDDALNYMLGIRAGIVIAKRKVFCWSWWIKIPVKKIENERMWVKNKTGGVCAFLREWKKYP